MWLLINTHSNTYLENEYCSEIPDIYWPKCEWAAAPQRRFVHDRKWAVVKSGRWDRRWWATERRVHSESMWRRRHDLRRCDVADRQRDDRRTTWACSSQSDRLNGMRRVSASGLDCCSLHQQHVQSVNLGELLNGTPKHRVYRVIKREI